MSSKGATLIFDADLNGSNGVTDSGGSFNWTPGTTATFINPLNPTALITGGVADIYDFGGNSQTVFSPVTINISTGTNIGGLIFGATGGSGYTLTASSAGQTLNIGTSGMVVNAGAFSTTVGSANLGNTLGGAETWTNASANPLNIAGSITNGTNLLSLAATGRGDINVSGSIVGGTGGGITVNSGTGTGVVTLSGANTQTGTTTLTAGILRATTSANALGTGAAALQLNGGTLVLTDGLAYNRNTTIGTSTTATTVNIQADNSSTGAGTTSTLGTLTFNNAATTLNVTAGEFATSGTGAGVTFTGNITLANNGNVLNTNNSFFVPGVTVTTTVGGSLTGNFNFTVGGTGSTVIAGGDTRTTGTLTKNGAGTLTLGTSGGTATFASSGAILINGGTINVTSGTTFNAGTKPALTFGAANTGGGAFIFNGSAAGNAQSLGALSFLGGDGVVQAANNGATSSLTFGSLAARTSGATGLFIASGGANGTTNQIVLGSVAPGANGIVIGGGAAGIAGGQAGGVYFFNTVTPVTTANPSDYAVYDAGSFVRAINYTADTTLGSTVAGSGVLAAGFVNQITTTSGTTGTVTQLATATVTGIKFASGTTVLATKYFPGNHTQSVGRRWWHGVDYGHRRSDVRDGGSSHPRRYGFRRADHQRANRWCRSHKNRRRHPDCRHGDQYFHRQYLRQWRDLRVHHELQQY